MFRDYDRLVTDDMREATSKETMDWLNGYISGPQYVETEQGLMVRKTK